MEHLTEHQHAFLDENNTVINVVVFEESAHDSPLLNDIQSAVGAVKIICCCTVGQIAGVGYTWVDNEFRNPQPFPSWIWDVENKGWKAPVAYPADKKLYLWDEDTLSWVTPPVETE
jgi:hypothetical protein